MKKNVIRLLLLVSLLGGSGAVQAAACLSQSSGNWSATGRWSCGQVPTASDTVTIQNGHTVTLNQNSASILALTVNAGGALDDSGTRILNLAGPLTVNGTGNINLSSSSIALAANSAWGGTATGTAITATALSLAGNNLTFSGTASYTMALSGTAPLTTSGGTFNNDSANKLVTVQLTAAAPSWGIANAKYPQLRLSTTGTKTYTASTLDVLGTLTVDANAVLSSASTLTSLNLGGPLVLNGSINMPAGTVTLTADSAWSGAFSGTALTASAINLSGKNLTFAAAASYTIALSGVTPLSNHGSFNNNGANKSVTIQMNGTNQSWTIYSTQYPNLQISNSGTKTYGASSITLLGSLTIDAGTTFDATAANSANTIAGNLTRNGVFSTPSGSGTWTFNGTSAQSITGGVTFYNMVVANGGNGVSLSNGNLAIGSGSSGSLQLTGGNVVTGSGNKVTISTPCTTNNTLVSGSGWINGNLQMTFPGFSTTCVFRVGDSTTAAPVTLDMPFSSGIGGVSGLTLTASTTAGEHPSIATSGLNSARDVNRYWTLGTSGDTFGCIPPGDTFNPGKYTATFQFAAADRDGGTTTASFKVGRFFGGGWAAASASATTATSTSILVPTNSTGVMFGTFAIGELLGAGTPSGLPPSSYCAAVPPLAEWRMDETTWTGATGEVKDSSGYGYHATAGKAAGTGQTATTNTGSSAYTNGTLSTCRYGQFDDNPTDAARSYTYVKLDTLPTLPAQFTFAGWVRTKANTVSGQRVFVNDDAQNGWGFSLGDGGAGTLRIFNRNISNSGSVTGGVDGACGVFCIDTPNVIANNTWHFVAVSVNTVTKDVGLYVFNNAGSTLANATGKFSGTWANGTGAIAIGGETAGEGTDINFHFRGNIDEVKVYNGALSETNLKEELKRSRSCGTLDHVELVHDGAALTCMAEPLVVLGCTSSASCYQLTASQSGDSFLVRPNAISGADWCSDAACTSLIPSSGITLSTGAVIYLRKTAVGSVNMGGTSTPATNATLQCKNTTNNEFGSTIACNLGYASSGLLLNAVNHLSCSAQEITIQAVSASDTSKTCVPAFGNVNRDLTISLSYVNPTSGTKGASFNYVTSSGGATSSVSALTTSTVTLSNLYWDATGKATLKNFSYPDVGAMRLNPSVAAPTGVVLGAISGHEFTVAPASFRFTTLPASPIKAGDNFTVKVSAMNACSIPAETPNFGKETTPENATLAFKDRIAPTGTNDSVNGPYDGTFSGTVTSWTSGVGTSSDSKWGEVGQMTLKATLANSNGYLNAGAGFIATGTSATIGDFVPAYFDTTVLPGCSNAFTYSGQPFTVTATAKNAQDGTTVNYSHFTNSSGVVTCSVCSHEVTLSDVNVASTPDGSFSNNKIAAADFKKGEGKTTTVTYTFTNKLTSPRGLPQSTQPVKVRAKDSNTALASPDPAGLTEGPTIMRSGRLRLSNAFGSEKQALVMPVRAEYWNGNLWVLNSNDSCTSLASTNFYRSNTMSNTSAVNIASGEGSLTLSVPGVGNTGSMDVAANLGATGSGNDQSCLSGHGGVPANLPWLRSVNGNCAATFDRDPSARATFGIYSQKRVVHVRELFQ